MRISILIGKNPTEEESPYDVEWKIYKIPFSKKSILCEIGYFDNFKEYSYTIECSSTLAD